MSVRVRHRNDDSALQTAEPAKRSFRALRFDGPDRSDNQQSSGSIENKRRRKSAADRTRCTPMNSCFIERASATAVWQWFTYAPSGSPVHKKAP